MSMKIRRLLNVDNDEKILKFIIFNRWPEEFKEDDSLMKHYRQFFQNAFMDIEEHENEFIIKYKDFSGQPGKMMSTYWFEKNKLDNNLSADMFYIEVPRNFKTMEENPIVTVSSWIDISPSYVPEYPDLNWNIKFSGIKQNVSKNQAWKIFKDYINDPSHVIIN